MIVSGKRDLTFATDSMDPCKRKIHTFTQENMRDIDDEFIGIINNLSDIWNTLLKV
jgi:hypothetical protein